MSDLFAAEPANADVSYQNTRAANCEGARTAREYCEALWVDFRALANRNFLGQFPVQFQQSWFQMYLSVSLLRANLNVACPEPGPDVRIDTETQPVWIEATAPTSGGLENLDAIPEPIYRDANDESVMMDVPAEKITLRISGAFYTKSTQLSQWINKGVVGQADPLMVAINIREIHHAWLDPCKFGMATVYGVGDQYIVIDRATRKAVEQGNHYRPKILKENQVGVDVAPFLHDGHKHIAAMLLSIADTANHPSRDGDDFILFHNPYASSPLSDGFFKRGREIRLERNNDGTWMAVHTNHLNVALPDV